MAIIKCKHCGTDIDAKQQGLLVCEACGGLQTAPLMNNEKKIQYFNLATRLRLAKDYDKGLQMYTKLAEQFDEVEPYYGKVLCKYGVQYVDEDVVCDVENLLSVLEDPDYQHACEIATDDEFELLEQEAALIDDFQQSQKAAKAQEAKKAQEAEEAKAAAEKAKKEAEEAAKAKKEKEFRGYYQEAKAYDIYICVSDKNRKENEVYQLAKIMKGVLKDDGKNVFFPHMDLKGLEDGDPKKEAYLQKALETSKLMLVFAGSKEELQFYKVKDRLDWFVELMENDNTKKLVPCFQNIAEKDIPANIKNIKYLDLSKESFIDDVMDAVDAVFKVKVEPLKPEEKYYGKATAALSKGDFANAIKNIDLCIKSDSKFPDSYRVAILASCNVTKDEELKTPIADNKYYKMALEEGDKSVEALAAKVNEIIYQAAIKMPHSNETEVKAYVDALTPIKEYKDVQALIDDAYGPIYEPKYQEAIATLQKGLDTKFERYINEGVRLLSAIIPYKDSAEKVEEGKAFVEKLNDDLYKDNYEKAKDLYNTAVNSQDYAACLGNFLEASKILVRMLSYKDARSLNLKCKEMAYNYAAMVIFKAMELDDIEAAKAQIKSAMAALEGLKPYKDAEAFIQKAQIALRDLNDPKKLKERAKAKKK